MDTFYWDMVQSFEISCLHLQKTFKLISISAKSSSRVQDSPGLIVTDESGKEAPGFVPPHPDSQSKDDAAPWRRPGSLRARPTNR